MFIVQRAVVRRVRFHERNNQNERIAFMFFDEFARVLCEKLRSRQFEWQVADRQFRKSSILFVRGQAP